MSQMISRVQAESFPEQFPSAAHPLSLGGDLPEAQVLTVDTPRPLRLRTERPHAFVNGIKRRLKRERRRRKVGRAYDMALEIARVIPFGSEVLDVGCGNGFIAHHLSAMLGGSVVGIDLAKRAEAPIDYRHYDGARFPAPDKSFDAVLFCYVLHHAQDVDRVVKEMRRVLRNGGLAVIYEDMPLSLWDRGVCWIHDRQWRGRTGPCRFRREHEWRTMFSSFNFEIVIERRLSRGRNLAHPVARTMFVLRLPPTRSEPAT